MLRKSFVGAVAGAVALAVAIVAYANPASDTTFSVKAGASPSKSGTPRHPRLLRFSLNATGGTKSGTGQPQTSTNILIRLPSEWVVNLRRWPRRLRCDDDKADAQKTDSVCPKGSRIGSGHVTAKGGGGSITEEIDVKAYVEKSGDLGLFIRASVPITLAQMLDGKVSGHTINVVIPPNVQSPAGVATGIQTLRFALKARARIRRVRRGLLESRRCRTGKWPLTVTNKYTDGSKTQTVNLKCRR